MKHLRIDGAALDAIIELLGATLQEMGVAEGLIQQVAAIAESTRNDVLNR